MEKENKKVLFALILALIACLIWAGNNIAARYVANWMDPISVAFWRFVIAFFVLIPFIIKNFKKNFALLKENIRLYFWMGFTAITLKNLLYFTAAHFTSANNLALLGTTSLIWTAVIGAITKLENLNKYKIAGIFSAGAGALMIVLKGNINNLIEMDFGIGDLIILVAEAIWGIYTILLRLKHKDMDGTFMFAAMVFFGLLGLLPLYIVYIQSAGLPTLDTKSIYAYIYIGIFASVISWLCYNYSVSVIGPVRTSITLYLLPVFTAIMGYFLLGEKIHSFHVYGFVLIVAGIFISNRKANEKQ